MAAREDADIYVAEDVMDRAGKKTGDGIEDSRELALKRFEEENRE